ncbi:NigD1/NigD2 family lipoprotein [Maribellus maritimus]|uniref:NigD1/NigD2 family lipoprotein n=1 Tax=Maribellus maritimus TaxID=2870838 RepID=UPI001EEC504D|nr:NigD-like C-terminal domain-containing protein [Maribellus maritimus]MCG6186057.1 NigD-like protein [Maribellus maritimus]
MKQLLITLIFAVFLFASCQQDDEVMLMETGTVVDYAGAASCGVVIELDNGNRIQPLYFPDGFTFTQGQRVLVEYKELPNIIPTCDRGTASDISYVEELNCAPYINLNFNNYDSLARDPVFIHEAFVDGDCLQIKLSYSGGCQEHTIDLARMHPWVTGSSNIPTLEIRHNANGDMCEALFTKELRFDLTPLKQEGKTEFVLTAKLADGEDYSEIFDLN